MIYFCWGGRMKTLYVSDLDGTLLRSDQKTSLFTNDTINRLIEKGMMFSYATARSFSTAHKVTEGLTANFPVIVYNGTFIRNNDGGTMILKNTFDKDKAVGIARELIGGGVQPIVYSLIGGEEKFSYIADEISRAERDFILTRKGDSRDRPIKSFEQLTEGEIFYFTCIDEPEKLEPFYEKYKDGFNCFYQSDIYSSEQWLEIIPESASKSKAAKQLEKLLGCEKLVVFGDGINDIDLFEAADECYAVENADSRLKAIATGIIPPNNDDGVARFLIEHFR